MTPDTGLIGRRALGRPSRPHRLHALLDGGLHVAVVVLRDEAVHPALEQEPHHRIEGLVGLTEVHASAAAAEVFEAGPPGRSRPERLADGVVAPGLAGLHLRQPLPRAT